MRSRLSLHRAQRAVGNLVGVGRVRSAVPLICLCASICALALMSAPALAVRQHLYGSSFASAGAGNGQLSNPAGIAISESTGDVYVADQGNNRVEYFSSAGAYIGQYDGSGLNLLVEGKAAPTGQFSSPGAIAIDNDPSSPSFGDVYVVDTGHEVIDKYSPTGEYIGQLTETSGGSKFGAISGVATDASGNFWVCQQSREIDAFSGTLANEFVSRITSTGLPFGEIDCNGLGFGVDSKGDLFTKSGFIGVGKLDSSGKVLIEKFDSLLTEFFGVELGAVAVDLSNNDVYIGNADDESSIGRISTAGSPLETFGAEQLAAGHASGIAIDSKTGAVFVADSTLDKVDIFVPEPPSRPVVEAESASAVTATTATLGAQINPTGPDSTYYFQYGTVSCAVSPSSCIDLPASPGVDIGAGFDAQSVSLLATDLQSATTYHYRVLAINELGTTEGVEKTFTTQASGTTFTQPDGRQWEMVTPPEKHGAGIIAVGNEQGDDIQAAENGGAITFGATSPFVANPAGSNSPEVTQVFSARRAPGSWETTDITTPHNEGATEIAVGHSAEYKLFSSDLSLGMVEPMGHTPLPPLPAGSEKTVYLRKTNGEYLALVTSANVPTGTKFNGNGEGAGGVEFVSASLDLNHVVLSTNPNFSSPTKLTPEGPESGLYEWAEGHFQLVSVLPNGESTSGSLGYRGATKRHAISNDGSRIVFEGGEHLNLRDMVSKETIRVDAAQGTPEPASVYSRYATADGNGSRVFFTSSARLTANSTAQTEDLYEFEVTSGKGEPLAGKLTDLTVDGNAGESADVRGVIEASEGGSYVYFVANGVLGDGAERGAKPGRCEQARERFKARCNLYVARYDAGTKAWNPPSFIATLSGADSESWDSGGGFGNLKQMTSRVSPNGRYLAFMSERSLTGYENRDANSGVPDEEVFLYDASAGRLVCSSCNPTGARPVGLKGSESYEERLWDYAELWGGRWVAGDVPGWTTTDLSTTLYQSRYLSNNGRLFFNSSDALVPADVNGKEDVYEYEPAGVGSCQPPDYGRSASDVFVESIGGCVALISAGTSSEESAFMDAGEGGGDVFFQTLSRLSPQDFDTSIDLYDAHECTPSAPCAPAPALVPPTCTTGDACKSAPTPQPSIFGVPSSATFTGAGNIVPGSHGAQKVTNAQKLVKALKACTKKPKRKRAACKRQARKKYGAKKAQVGKSLSPRTRR